MDDTTNQTPGVPTDPTQPGQKTDVPMGGPTPPPVTPSEPVPSEPAVPPVQEPTTVPPVPGQTPPVGGTDQDGTQGMA